jgi:hypothetical protein
LLAAHNTVIYGERAYPMSGQQLRTLIRRYAGRAFLVFAVLAGQHAAVSHQIWHASDASASEGKSSTQRQLCDFHSALDAVLGIVTTAALAWQFEEAPHARFDPPGVLAIAAPPPLPSSRGPPPPLAL